MSSVRVHSLEGRMVASKEGMLKLLDIYQAKTEETQIFVVSPLHETTLSFKKLLNSAVEKDERLWALTEKAQGAWISLAESILPLDERNDVEEQMKIGFSNVEDILQSVWLLGDASNETKVFFASLTNYFLSILAAALFNSRNIHSAIYPVEKVLNMKDFSKGAYFIYGKLEQNSSEEVIEIKNYEGESEYTASLIAASLHSELTFWNDRSLLCSARKKDIPSARVIETLTYAEATELSFFGAPIVHPHSFIPASKENLSIQLAYFGDIDNEGTLITNDKIMSDGQVKAFSVINNISIINIEGAGMSGVPGISSRLFSAMRDEGISVILISQASSEYSICIAIPSSQSEKAYLTARNEFKKELLNHTISSIDIENDLAIIAAVGEAMTGQVGVSGKFFSSLAKAGVNVRAIAQGSSERNISAVISKNDSIKALSAVHAVFFLSSQTISIGLLGPGNIGGTLLEQIAVESEKLRKRFDVDIQIRGIADVDKMMLSEEAMNLDHWRESFTITAEKMDLDKFVDHINPSYYPHAAIIDCTTSGELAKQYASWMKKGIHVITPNKKAATGPYSYYKEMMKASKKTGMRFLYETTVGAGLPIITTLKDLILTGDEILKIEGIVSGTLAWLFSKYDGTMPFSELVKEAKNLGYTEPDPRDDLSGMDVARKTVILAREMGIPAEIEDLSIRSLVPENLKDVSKDEFLARCNEMDEEMLTLFNEAKAKGQKLRYVGKIDHGVCSVSLEGYDDDHPFAQAVGTNNVISFTTERYFDTPLVVKGPGAGREVTAGGVFADILRLSAYLGARL